MFGYQGIISWIYGVEVWGKINAWMEKKIVAKAMDHDDMK